jgi:hypothetical protein
MKDSQARDATVMAIEVMTAMLADTGGKDFAMERVRKVSEEGGRPALDLLTGGLINLAGSAIAELSRQTKVPELELLQQLAMNVQRES